MNELVRRIVLFCRQFFRYRDNVKNPKIEDVGRFRRSYELDPFIRKHRREKTKAQRRAKRLNRRK